MFNEYVWQNYLKAGGREIVELFKNNIENEFTEDYAYKICNLHKAFCPSKEVNRLLKTFLLQISEDLKSNELMYACYSFENLSEETDFSAQELLDVLFFGIDDGNHLSDKVIFEEFSIGISYYTTFLAYLCPELFTPYYFKFNFNIVEKIANEFGINLPEMPIKKDYKGRFFYYGELCVAFNEFRLKHNMSPYEFCAFIYDFAPKYIGGIDSYIVKDLPSAKCAYFIGGEKDDSFLTDEDNIITPWQCNPDTMAGDNIVMYVKSPVSAINSVWRSVSPGFNDPFFYYYRCTYIANPQKIKKVTLKTLERDKFFKQLPIVRKNMQGLNGVELYPSAYNHLLDISKSDLPRLEFVANNDYGDLKREKDVENKLIKPFLKKLGYTEDEYTQQLHIHVGNNNSKLIPDFVIHPNISIGHHSAELIIEAKYTVASEKDLEIYKMQARSYANQLKAKYSVIASKEGIWVSSETDDFTRDFFVFTWLDLNDSDIFQRVLKFLGNGNVLKSAETRKRLNGRAAEFMMFKDLE
ncbi:MAG: hypothetical protein IJC37_01085 [Clostridia bacterium]|nr:hypothetical protein [Clostridia bacterium]MBQ4338001.1 hypothetical protein [Clostridia bacterium]